VPLPCLPTGRGKLRIKFADLQDEAGCVIISESQITQITQITQIIGIFDFDDIFFIMGIMVFGVLIFVNV
jgi:hypothetical protein